MVGHFKYLTDFLSNHYLIKYTHSNAMFEHAPGVFLCENFVVSQKTTDGRLSCTGKLK